MTRFQYAGVGSVPPSPSVVLGSGDITVAKEGQKTFWLQARNRQGYSQMSSGTTVGVVTGSSIEITIPSAARQGAWDVVEWSISCSTDTNPQNAAVLVVCPGYELDGVTPIPLPATIILSEDEHLELSKTVAQIVDLPDNPVHGMRRSVSAIGQIVQWDAINDEWKRTLPPSFSTYVATTQSENGSDRDISLITDTSIFVSPEYAGDGSVSQPVTYWIVNDSNINIPQGTGIRIAAQVKGEGISEEEGTEDISLAGLLHLSFLGYANTSNGLLDTSGMVVNTTVDYQGQRITNLRLPKALPPGYAFAIRTELQLQPFHLNNRLPQGATIQLSMSFAPDYAVYNEAGQLLGDFIVATGDRRRILPSGGLGLVAKPGSGCVARYSFDGLGEQIIPGLLPNVSNQKIVITGNGTCFTSATVPSTAALRAIASTVDGVGKATIWSNPIALDGTKLLSIEIQHPTFIRTDYPDSIAGMSSTVNAGKIRVYTRSQSSGTITYFDVVVTGLGTEIVSVGGGSGTSAGTTLPVISESFGLFSPVTYTPSTTTGGSTFTNGSYEIAIAYLYENAVTEIDHKTSSGCIAETSGTISDLFALGFSWGEAIGNVDLSVAIREIPEPKTYPWQRRPIYGGETIYYHPLSTDADNGTSIWKPEWRSPDQPGRWILDPNTAWHEVDDEPPAGLGSPGDFALNTSTGEISKKTSATEWTSLGSLRGPQGEPGLTYEGSWDDAIAYSIGSVVIRENSTWVAKTDNTAVDPVLDNGTNWGVLVRGIRYRGVYDEAIAYQLNDLVKNADDTANFLYINPTSVAGTDVTNAVYWLRMGRVGADGPQGLPGDPTILEPRGEYALGTTYNKYDLVSYQGSSYVYLSDTPTAGNVPTNTAYWQLNAAKGDAGEGGTSGVTSFNSRSGAVLPTDGDYTAEQVGAAAGIHATNHLAGGSDAIAWTTVHGEGTLELRPTAAPSNAGYFYRATNVNGGTLYRSNGTSWGQCAPGVSQSGGGGSSSDITLLDKILTHSGDVLTYNGNVLYYNG